MTLAGTWRVTAWHVTRAIPAKCCKSCQFVTIFIVDIPCIVIPAAIMLPWLIQIDCNSDSWLAHRHPGYINKYFLCIVWKSASPCIYCLATSHSIYWTALSISNTDYRIYKWWVFRSGHIHRDQGKSLLGPREGHCSHVASIPTKIWSSSQNV